MPKKASKLATIILPTGTGKTACTIMAIQKYREQNPNIKVLWGAHREELIDQAFNEFKSLIPDANTQIEMAANRAEADADIVVGSVQTLHRNRKNIKNFMPDLVVIDEWHHYDEKNKTYHGLRERYDEAKFLGLTATPYRFSGGDLPLGETLIEMDIGTAVRHNYLVPPNPTVLKTNVSLANVSTRAGDFAINELSAAVNVQDRNEMIAKRIISTVRDEGRKGILYAVDVAHSKAMCNLLRKEVRVGEVYGETDKEERRELMKQIRAGDIDVLCNNLVCTEGFDVPHIGFVCIARPTKSLGLYTQMMGRGLRLSDGKSDCLVIDVFDKVKTTQGRIKYSDVASAGDIDGNRHRSEAILSEEIADKLQNFPVVLRLQEGGRWLVDNEKWFAPSWVLAENQWVITWSKSEERVETDEKEQVNFKYAPTSRQLQASPISVKHRFWGEGVAYDSVGLDVTVDFGKFGTKKIPFNELTKEEKKYNKRKLDKPIKRALFICMSYNKNYGRFISLKKSGRNTYDIIEDIKGDATTIDEMIKVTAEQDDMVQIMRGDAKWRKSEISPKQKDIIKKYVDSGMIGDDIDLNSLTKGDASVIMDQVTWHQPINELFGAKTSEELIGYNSECDDV